MTWQETNEKVDLIHITRQQTNETVDLIHCPFRWGDVWPAARTFHPAVVPLPVSLAVCLYYLQWLNFPFKGAAGCGPNKTTNPTWQICKHGIDEGGLLNANLKGNELIRLGGEFSALDTPSGFSTLCCHIQVLHTLAQRT